MKINKFVLVTIAVIFLDQAVKMLVHFNMELGYPGEIKVLGDWFRLHYIHNPGMAFGITIDSDYGKLILTLFRILAITALVYFFHLQIKQKAHPGFLVCLALILGGAIGNGIDSVFYGVLFDITTQNAATPWFHGKVIDMLYFPLFNGTFPAWLPEWSPMSPGDSYTFFSAIFNIADSSIFIGALSILVFNKKFFTHNQQVQEKSGEEDESHKDLLAISEVDQTQETTIEPDLNSEEE